MSKKPKQTPKTWVEVFQSERKKFPIGCCITRIIPNKNAYNRKQKHKGRELDD